MKKFLQNLWLYRIKIPVMVVILFIGNTWKVWLVGIIMLLLLFLVTLTENYMILMVYLTLISSIPLCLYIKNLICLIKLTRHGVKTQGTIWIVKPQRRGSGGYVQVYFTDENGTEYAPKIYNWLIFPSMVINKKISVIYDKNNPENACLSAKSVIENVISAILSMCLFVPFLIILICFIRSEI
ncbi:MAG: hypothetical protein K2J47_09195 [Ruminococcus sp.]|nr:hypothetical protein [Ruminococcus sp.]